MLWPSTRPLIPQHPRQRASLIIKNNTTPPPPAQIRLHHFNVSLDDILWCCWTQMYWIVFLLLIFHTVFAQYEDHLSVYDWCPDQTLRDWLPGVVCCPLNPSSEKHCMRLWVLTARRLSSWRNPVYGSNNPPPHSRDMKAGHETITSAHQCSALKALHAVLNRGGLQGIIARLLLLSRCVDMLSFLWAKVRAFFNRTVQRLLLLFIYSGGLHRCDQHVEYFDMRWDEMTDLWLILRLHVVAFDFWKIPFVWQ